MYFESRLNTQQFYKLFRRVPPKVWAVVLALLVLLSGVIWYEMSGARAATMDLINSNFEGTDGSNWTVYGTVNAAVYTDSTDYNHTTGGSQSAGVVTQTVGGAVYNSGGIERSFRMPSGTTNNVTLSVYYRNTSASSLNIKWEIVNTNGVRETGGTIKSDPSETAWTNYNVTVDKSQLQPSFNYILKLYAEGTTVNQPDASMGVYWDDVLLTAEYQAEPTTVNVFSSRSNIPGNNITTTTVTAVVYDQNDKLMDGQEVIFSQNPAGGTFVGSPTVNTNPEGTASVEFKSDTGGDIVITATAGTKSDSTTITVLYPNTLKVSSSLGTIPNNTTTTNIVANVLDQFGNPLEGMRVDFSASSPSGKLGSFSPGNFDVTDSKGNADVKFSSTDGETYTITATSGSKSAKTKVIVQAPTTVLIDVDKTVISNDDKDFSTVTAFLKDQYSQPMNGVAIEFIPTGGTVSLAEAVTRSDGRVQTKFKSATGGNYTVKAQVKANTSVSVISDVIKVSAPSNLIITSDPAIIPKDGKTTSTITATLTDQTGAPIKDEPLDFSTNIGVFTSTNQSTANGLITDANGKVVFYLKSSTEGAAAVTGTVPRAPAVTGSTNVTIVAPQPQTMYLSASKSSIPNDDTTSVTVTATVYDQFNNLLSGETVSFGKLTANGSFLPGNTAITDSAGKASVQFKSSVAETVTIQATCGIIEKSVDVTVEERIPNSLTLTASPAAIPDDGNQETTLTAHVTDQFGNPLAGKLVEFAKSQTWGTLSSLGATTDSSGNARVTFGSNTAGIIGITATSGTKSDVQTVTVQQRRPATLTLTSNSSTILLGTGSATITVNLKDQFGMPISGQQINFSTGLGKLSAITAVTDAGGFATVVLSSELGQEQTGPAVVAGKVNGTVPVTGMVTVEFRNPDNTKPTLVKAEPTSKQVIYLTFSEKIKFASDPPTGWTIKKYVNEIVYGEVQFNTPVIMSGDRRIVMVTLKNNMDKGNQYPDQIRYEITVDGVYDLADNLIDSSAVKASFNSFTPHGKYATYPVTAGNSTRICAQCHSNHKAVRAKLLTGTTVKKVCFVCHGNTGISVYKVEEEFYRGTSGDYSPSMHKALDSDSPDYDNLTCVDCHNPHGNKRPGSNEILPKLLRARDAGGTIFTSSDGNRFCLACHGNADANEIYGNRLGSYWNATLGDHSGGMTVEGGVYGSAHFDNRFDSLKSLTGTDITCLKCHEKHGSKNSRLMDNSLVGTSPEEQCYKCHNTEIKDKFQGTGGNISKHSVTGFVYDGLTCRSCHEPHSTAARSYADAIDSLPSDISDPSNTKNNWNKSDGTISEFCIKCHDVESGATIASISNATTLVPFTVTLPGRNFANGTGWNKSAYVTEVGSAHYSETVKIDCNRCHDPHGSGNQRLTILPEDPDEAPTSSSGMCLRCHGGGESPQGADVYTGQFGEINTHPTLSVSGKHSDTEDYSKIASADRHAECYDCHDPHTVKSTENRQTAKLGRVSGVQFSQTPWNSWDSASGTEITLDDGSNSRQAYLCYKCHSKYAYTTPPTSSTGWQSEVFTQTDIAMEFNPDNSSRHVVEGSSQMPAYTVGDDNNNEESKYYGKFNGTSSATDSMKCTDCHGSSSVTSGGSHGSEYTYILRKPWNNNTGKAGTENDLCFDCHNYAFYAGEDAGSFTERSQFSNEGNFNLHSGQHAGKGCVKCHGAVPHGWLKTDSSGGGLSIVSTAPEEGYSRPYTDGVAITSLGATDNTPGNWAETTCTTACH